MHYDFIFPKAMHISIVFSEPLVLACVCGNNIIQQCYTKCILKFRMGVQDKIRQ